MAEVGGANARASAIGGLGCANISNDNGGPSVDPSGMASVEVSVDEITVVIEEHTLEQGNTECR